MCPPSSVNGASVLLMSSTGARVGVSGVVSLLALGLHDLGCAVSVLCCMDERSLAEELRAHRIPVELHAVRRIVDPGATRRLRDRLVRDRIDILHTHGQRAMIVGNVAARLAGTPAVVTTFHEHSWVKAATRPRSYRLFYAAEGGLARGATDACVAVCQSVLEDAVRARRVPREKLTLIHNAADPARFPARDSLPSREALRRSCGLGPDDYVIGTLGSLMPIKAHEDLIAALPIIRRRIPSARLLIAGVGPRRAALERRAAEAGVAADVIFAGEVAAAERLYPILDVVAVSSLSETCSLVVLEAFACGVPVVATAVGGIPELVRAERDGLLVPPRAPAALAGAIIAVASERALRERLVSSGRARAERFSQQVFIGRHVELYRRLLERSRSVRGRTSG